MTTTTKLAYDKSGRLTTQYVPGGEAHYYTYNQRNMVTSIVDLGGPDATRTFSYNGLGERVVVIDNVNAQPAYWSYDGRKFLRDKERTSLGGFNTRAYRHNDTPQDCPLGSQVKTVLSDGTALNPAMDAAGSVQSVGSDNFVYSSYGEEIIAVNTQNTRLHDLTPAGSIRATTTQPMAFLSGGAMRIVRLNLLVGGVVLAQRAFLTAILPYVKGLTLGQKLNRKHIRVRWKVPGGTSTTDYGPDASIEWTEDGITIRLSDGTKIDVPKDADVEVSDDPLPDEGAKVGPVPVPAPKVEATPPPEKPTPLDPKSGLPYPPKPLPKAPPIDLGTPDWKKASDPGAGKPTFPLPKGDPAPESDSPAGKLKKMLNDPINPKSGTVPGGDKTPRPEDPKPPKGFKESDSPLNPKQGFLCRFGPFLIPCPIPPVGPDVAPYIKPLDKALGNQPSRCDELLKREGEQEKSGGDSPKK